MNRAIRSAKQEIADGQLTLFDVSKYIKTDPQIEFEDDLNEILDEIHSILLEKNRKYGDSALNPVRIFSKADASEQIKVRIDDKLSRIANQQSDDDEDAVLDLIGYLLLLRISQKREK